MSIVNTVVTGAVSHRRTLIGLIVVGVTMCVGAKIAWVSDFEESFKVFMAMMGTSGVVVGYLFGRQSGRNNGGNGQEVD